MKSFFTSLLLLLITFLHAQNSIIVFSEDALPFILYLNGVAQNPEGDVNIQMDNLTADYYQAKVEFLDPSIPPLTKKYLLTATQDCKPCAVSYNIKKNKKGEFVLKGYAFNEISSPPLANNDVTVVQYTAVPLSSIQITETTTTTVSGNGNHNHDNVNVGVNAGGFNLDIHVNDNSGVHQTTTTTSVQTITTTNIPTEIEDECSGMTVSQYNDLIFSISKVTFSEEKEKIAKQGIRSNCVYAKQVKGIMEAFDWEDSRLDIAKYAYSFCVDKKNYYTVNDAFEWSDSIEELDKVIHP